jgi:hypothetical protein
MKRYFIAVRLIFFIGVATVLYMNASSTVGSDRGNGKDVKNSMSIKLEDSYKIWKAVNFLQSKFYADEVAKKNALRDIRISTARKIIASYSDLNSLFDELTQAYSDANLQQFLAIKEQIALTLRPIWSMAAHQEQVRRSELGFVGRLKEDFIASVSRVYNYFSSFRIFAKK